MLLLLSRKEEVELRSRLCDFVLKFQVLILQWPGGVDANPPCPTGFSNFSREWEDTVAHKGQCNKKWFAANKKIGCKQKRSDANKKDRMQTKKIGCKQKR